MRVFVLRGTAAGLSFTVQRRMNAPMAITTATALRIATIYLRDTTALVSRATCSAGEAKDGEQILFLRKIFFFMEISRMSFP